MAKHHAGNKISADIDTKLASSKQHAVSCIQAQRFEEARKCYAEICRQWQDDAESWFMQGALSGHLGLFDETIACCLQAVLLRPDYVEAHYNLAQAYMHQGQLAAAIGSYRQVAILQPDHAGALNNLGYALQKQEKYEEALELHVRALKLQPGFLEAMHNLGNALYGLGRLGEALACYKQILQINSDYAPVFHDVAVMLFALGMTQEAEHYYRRAIQFRPDAIESKTGLLIALNYHSRDQDLISREHALWAKQHEFAAPISQYLNDPIKNRRLRVGYVSPDFRSHSVTFFFEPLLANHNKAIVEIYCYANAKKTDEVTERLKQHAAVWRDIRGMSDTAVAEMIQKDKIDILVDLAGHSANNRLMVFARKPAPVQVTYLGYPNTTGLTTIDYRLTDAWADPLGQPETWHSETLLRLPHGFLCYAPHPDAPGVERVHKKHERLAVTFGSFNNLAKITPEVIAVWAKILSAVQNSCILLKSKLFWHEIVCEHIYAQFEAQGIERARVDLRKNLPSVKEHLAIYKEVDIALDTFPYNGTTTTCEALWMGVPVITLAGVSHAGRVGVSLLSRLGMQECIAENPEGLVKLAVELANQPEVLARMRLELRQRMLASSLCDAKLFTSQVEEVYRGIWQQWCVEPC